MLTVIFETCLWTQSDWIRAFSTVTISLLFKLFDWHYLHHYLTGFLHRYMVKPQDDTGLVSLSLQQLVKSVSARTAAPGGGSVSAAVAALV